LHQKQSKQEIKVEEQRVYFSRIHDEELERELRKVVADKYIKPVVCH